MSLLFEYLCNLSACITASYLFYYLLLRRMTCYTWNRWFLLLFSVVSFIIPLARVRLPGPASDWNAVTFIHQLPFVSRQPLQFQTGTNGSGPNSQAILFIIFISVAGILLLRLLIQVLSLKRLQAKAQLVKDGTIKLYHLPGNTPPFSFNKSIYVNQNNYSEAELQKIIRHELVHVTQRHTIDVLIAELLCIINWFNPFAWLIRLAIKQNLEFIADDQVLQYGTGRKGYQYLLLKVTGNIPYYITTNLNFSSLKQRIYMMNKTKTARVHLLKFLFIIPLGCLLLVAFRSAYENKSAMHPSEVKGSAESFRLGSLTYFINDDAVEAIVKKDQANSYLQPGGALNLSLLSDEKNRLKDLLRVNGYEHLGPHAITFLMDTSSTSKSFSVQVTIHIAARDRKMIGTNNRTILNTPETAFAEKPTIDQSYTAARQKQ